jgi:hypothetical protein
MKMTKTHVASRTSHSAKGHAGAHDRKIVAKTAGKAGADKDCRDSAAVFAIELFQPNPEALYSLDTVAHLTGASRRSIMVYCRAGLLRPVFQPPYGRLAFTGEAICTARRIQNVRTICGAGAGWLKVMLEVLGEVERLRAEVRFLRNNTGNEQLRHLAFDA